MVENDSNLGTRAPFRFTLPGDVLRALVKVEGVSRDVVDVTVRHRLATRLKDAALNATLDNGSSSLPPRENG